MSASDHLPTPDITRSAPRWRLLFSIAHGALVPMALMALSLWWLDAPWQHRVAVALNSYAAMFAAFVGGFHWGLGLRYMATTAQVPTFHFVWGPVPAYLAWGTLMLEPRIALPLMCAVFALAYLVDHRTWPGTGLGPWLGLRRQITAGTIACCLVGAVGVGWMAAS